MKRIQILLYILIIQLLISCTKGSNSKFEDPIYDFNIGDKESVWNSKVGLLLASGELSDQLTFKYDNKEEKYLTFKSFFTDGIDSIKSDVSFNDTPYSFGNLRTIDFNLKGDSILSWNEDEYIYTRSYGSRKKEEVDKVYNWFIQYYGKPDDTLEISRYESYIYHKLPSDCYAVRQSEVLRKEDGSYIWNKNGYYIEFYMKNDKMDSLRYSDAFIRFISNSAEKEIINISDSIQQTLRANDLVKIELNYPKWKKINNYNDTKFTLKIGPISRKGIEEPRVITDIKIDVLFKDNFNDVIYKIADFKIKLTVPIKPYIGLIPINNEFIFYQNYNIKNNDYIGLEKVRKLKRSEYKIEYLVKSVVFEDGNILHSNY